MKHIRRIAEVLLLLSSSILFAQPGSGRMMPKDLNLTDAQKDQFEKIDFDMQKKQIDIGAKLATLKLEMNRLINTDPIDKAAIEKKMNDMAAQTIALRMNHLNAWSEKNKLLNADQQKIWKKVLIDRVRMMQDAGSGDMMHGNLMGRGMRKGMMERHPGADMDNDQPRMERHIEKEIIKQQ